MTFASGSFDAADNGFMNMLVGPIFSRPLVQSLHACASIGFLTIATLLSLLLPKAEENSDKLCYYLKNPEEFNDENSNNTMVKQDEASELSVLFAPCYIIGTWIFITGAGFVFIGMSLKFLHMISYEFYSLLQCFYTLFSYAFSNKIQEKKDVYKFCKTQPHCCHEYSDNVSSSNLRKQMKQDKSHT